MTPADGDRDDDPPPRRQPDGKNVDNAFDLWLQRGLHQIFDAVANEPVPEELRKLIEDDRGE